MARPSETGSHAAHEAPAGLRPSGFDPARKELTEGQRKVLDYLTERANADGLISASMAEIATHSGIGGTSAYNYIEALDRKGYLRCIDRGSNAGGNSRKSTYRVFPLGGAAGSSAPYGRKQTCRSFAHPDYVYRPWPEWLCRRLSAIHRKRLGIPDGHYRLWGVHVPAEHTERMREYALIVARLKGPDDARDFLESAKAADWQIERPNLTKWGLREWQLYRDLIAEGMSREDVAKYADIAEWYLNRGVNEHRKGRRI